MKLTYMFADVKNREMSCSVSSAAEICFNMANYSTDTEMAGYARAIYTWR